MGMRLKEMTVSTVETGPHPEAMRREDLLQVAMLGALIANKELRKEIEPEFFSDRRFQCAASELKGSGGGFKYLHEVLRDILGVLWDRKTPPLEQMQSVLKNNGIRQGVLDYLMHAAEAINTEYRTPSDLDRFFGAVIKAGELADEGKQGAAMELPSQQPGGRNGTSPSGQSMGGS